MFHQDDYNHPLPNIKYIKESILGPGGDKDAFYTWFETICTCSEDSSCLNHCECTERYGENYNDCLLSAEKLSKEYCIYECSAFCSCGELCSNKVVQRGPNPNLEIKYTKTKGYGVFSMNALETGTFICEYAGEIISRDVADERYKNENNNKYILMLREHYASGNVLETCFDAFTYGNIARYINHSCSPNCVVIPVRTGCLIPKAAVFSSRPIKSCEEISYSYSQNGSTLSNTKCCCDSPSCLGFLPSHL